jgi:hypothetical protein
MRLGRSARDGLGDIGRLLDRMIAYRGFLLAVADVRGPLLRDRARE